MKKIFWGVVVVLVLLAMFSITIFAAEETEPNDSIGSATEILVNTSVSGNLSSDGDVDWYKFIVVQDGFFYVDFQHEIINDTAIFWEIRLFDSTGLNYIDGIDSCLEVAGNQNGITNTLGVSAGEYYIKISKNHYSGANYTLKVKYESAADWETENNNSSELADLILTDTIYHGVLSAEGDVDWYKFTIKQAGCFYVGFEHDYIDDPSTYWEIRLFDSTGHYIDGNDFCFEVPGNQYKVTNTFGVDEGTYYIKINHSNYSKAGYALNVKFESASSWEIENNSSKETAYLISTNRTYHGSLSTDGDVDWYKFKVTKSGGFYVDFRHEFIDDTSTYWRISLFDSTGINYIDGSSSYFDVNGNKNRTTNMFGISEGTYYIKINKDDYSGVNYTLSVEFEDTDNWESENNNDKSKANIIALNKTFKGSFSSNGDVDWFAFDVDSAREVAITFTPIILDSSSVLYWRFHLYDASGVTELLSYTAGENVEAVTTNYVSVTSGSYYFKIINESSSSANYSFAIREKHDCKGTFFIDKEATCTEEGKRHAVCDICGEIINETIPMIAHEFGEWNVTKEPACKKEGSRTRTCATCGYKQTETIAGLDHQFGEWTVAVERSCYHDGREERICSLCGEKETNYLPQFTHEYGAWKIISGSKLIPPIVKEKTCIHCGDVQKNVDWSFVWVPIVAGVALLGILIGVINYIRAFKKK